MKQLNVKFSILTTLPIDFEAVKILYTRHVLLNSPPNDSVKPTASIIAIIWKTSVYAYVDKNVKAFIKILY